MAERPKTQDADAVLSEHRLSHPLVERELALARVADVLGDVSQRLGPRHFRKHALPVVADRDHRLARFAPPLHHHVRGLLVQRVLHQLGDRLARIALRSGQVADELKRISNANLAAGDSFARFCQRSTRHGFPLKQLDGPYAKS